MKDSVNYPKNYGFFIKKKKYTINSKSRTEHWAKLTLPMRSALFLNPYIAYNANETAIMYAPNISPMKVYSPISFLVAWFSLGLFLMAVLERMRHTNADKAGITITATVKLKFSVNLENSWMPLGWMGVNWSWRGLRLRELYPFTNCRLDRAAKQGLSWESVTKEKKLICTTAIISIPTIFPAMMPIMQNTSEEAAIAIASFWIMLSI